MPPPELSADLFWRLDKIADAVNPALTLWALLVLWRHARQARARNTDTAPRRTLALWIGCVLLVFVAAHLNRWLHLWPGHKYFPSGHIAYTACLASLGWTLERRSLWLTAPLIGLYSVLIVQLGYHVWADIIGALILAPALTLWALRTLERRFQAPVADPTPT